jgi:hypothetical protein
MITPGVGQIVRLADHEEKLVVKSLSENQLEVELVSMTDHPFSVSGVAITDLLPGEDLSAG